MILLPPAMAGEWIDRSILPIFAGWREEFERLWPSRRGDPGPRES